MRKRDLKIEEFDQGTVQVQITWLHPGGGWVITEKNSTDRFSPLGRNGVVESDFGPAK